MKADIITVINAIPDYTERLILSLKYCEGMTFLRISMKISYCERSVKYIHGTALNSFEAAYKRLHSAAPGSAI